MEIFKKLTKKGYKHYYEGTVEELDSMDKNNPNLHSEIMQAIIWLYEKHRIWVEVRLTDNSRDYYFDYTIITSKDRDFNDEDGFDSAKIIYDKNKHNSPTEAYEAAIEYTLNNLI